MPGLPSAPPRQLAVRLYEMCERLIASMFSRSAAAFDRGHAVPNTPFEAQQGPDGDAYGLFGQLYIDVAPTHLNGGRGLGVVLLNHISWSHCGKNHTQGRFVQETIRGVSCG